MELVSQGDGIEEGAGGAGGYFHGLIPALSEDRRISELVLYVPSWYERQAQVWRHPKVRIVALDASQRRPLRVIYEQTALPRRAQKDDLDVLFSPGNFRPLRYRGANVLGLHAIQYFLLDDDIGRLRAAYLRYVVPRGVRSADVVITATDTLRRDAIELFGPDPERMVTVPMGPQPWVTEFLARDEDPEPYALDSGRPYAMCISRLYALKNHRRLIDAFARFLERTGAAHDLAIVGGEADVTREELAAQAAGLGIGDRVHLMGRVAQEDVPRLYRGAAAIAYVSLYETFGHPVLEALATGTPLLTSSSGATAEVAGGAAVLADPEDVDSIADGLAVVLLDEARRAALVARGAERVREFSWEACARGTVDALERAVRARTETNGRAS